MRMKMNHNCDYKKKDYTLQWPIYVEIIIYINTTDIILILSVLNCWYFNSLVSHKSERLLGVRTSFDFKIHQKYNAGIVV